MAWLPPQITDSTTFGRGSQSPVLLLAEGLARGTEPIWIEQLQGLGLWGLQAPWLNACTLFKAITARARD